MQKSKCVYFILVMLLISQTILSAPIGFKVLGPDHAAISNAKKSIQNLALHLEQQQVKSLNELIYRMQIAIKQALQPYGYFSPSIFTKKQSGQSKPRVDFIVDLGPAVHVVKVEFSVVGAGKSLPKMRALQKQLPLREGMQLNTEIYKKAKTIFSQAAAQAGYIKNDFSIEELNIDTDNNTASIRLEFDTGPLYTFGATSFSSTPLSNLLLERYLTYRQGEAFNNQKLSLLQEVLGKSGYFKHVIVSPQLPQLTMEPAEQTKNHQDYDQYNLAYAIVTLLQNKQESFAIDLESQKLISYGLIPLNKPAKVFPVDQDNHFDLNVITIILESIKALQTQNSDQKFVLVVKNETGTSVASLKAYPWFKDTEASLNYQKTQKNKVEWLSLSKFKTSKVLLPIKQHNIQSSNQLSDSKIPVEVNLEPKNRNAHKISFGYGTNNGLRASFQSDFPIMNNSGHKLSTNVTLAKKVAVADANSSHIHVDTDYPLEASIEGKYSIPGFIPSQETFILESSHNRTSFYTPQGRKPAQNTMLTARYVNSKQLWNHSTNMTYLHETSKLDAKESFDMLSPSALWTYQKADHIVYPTQGFLASLQLRGATNLNDSKHNFFSVRGGWRQLVTATENFRSILRADLGFLSLLNQRFVPKTYQLLAGGSTSMRGFDYMSIGPGKLLATASADLQYQIASSWWFGLFMDGGNVYSEWKAIKSPQSKSDYTKQSHGLSLTSQTPVGALTFTYARAKRFKDRWRWQPKWHISIGSEI